MSQPVDIEINPPGEVDIEVDGDTDLTLAVTPAATVTVEVDRDDADPIQIQISTPATVNLEVTAQPAPINIPIQTPAVIEILIGEQGTPSGGGSTFARVAGETLSGHRLVVTQADGTVVYASNDDLACASKTVWLTLGAALSGDDVTVQSFGEVTEPSWKWTPDLPIFLGADGVPTQTPPAAGAALFIEQVAFPNTSTDVFFDPRTPIVFA